MAIDIPSAITYVQAELTRRADPEKAAGMQAWRVGSSGGQSMIDAVDPVTSPPDGLAFVATTGSGAYAGPYGLGVLHAWGRDVRPYRRILTAGAAFRREVFAP